MQSLPPELELRARLTLAALKIRKYDLDGGMHVNRAHAAVKVVMAKEHARERQASPRPFRSAQAGMCISAVRIVYKAYVRQGLQRARPLVFLTLSSVPSAFFHGV